MPIKEVVDYYNDRHEEKANQYESQSFEDVHPELTPYLPVSPAKVLDVGAGSGRDAAALEGMGFQVTAVDPALRLVELAQLIHGDKSIRWLVDSLPKLTTLSSEKESYALIIVSAVWMHIHPDCREESLRTLVSLLSMGGILHISFRSISKNDHVFHEVGELGFEALVRSQHLSILAKTHSGDTFNRVNTRWTSYVLKKVES